MGESEWNARSYAKHREDRKRRTREHGYLRRLRVNSLAMERGCTDCGYAEHPHALQWDHVRGEKEFPVSRSQLAWARVEAEMAKCEVVCANCHAIRTSARR